MKTLTKNLIVSSLVLAFAGGACTQAGRGGVAGSADGGNSVSAGVNPAGTGDTTVPPPTAPSNDRSGYGSPGGTATGGGRGIGTGAAHNTMTPGGTYPATPSGAPPEPPPDTLQKGQ